jgi:hypothetical protein
MVESDRAEVRLVGGDRALGPVVGGRGDVLEIELTGGAVLPVLVDRLESLRFPGRASADRRSGLAPGEAGDRLFWIRPTGLDRVDGTIEAFEEGGVRFDSVLGAKTFPWPEVAALFVTPLPDEGSEDGGAARSEVVLDLVDGGRLRGRMGALGGAGATLTVSSGEVSFPLGAVAEIVAGSGRIAFLSDLEPAAAFEGSPFDDDLGMRWPHRMDQAVTGGDLRSSGRRYARGIGVHAPSRLEWELDGTWKELRGAVAIDDSVLLLPHQGSVRFLVRVDGEERWQSGLVSGGQPPVTIPAVDLSGAKRLALEVDMATRFHVADRANWLRMLLVR